MIKIYFDKNIFSYLFKQTEEKYAVLLDKIYKHKDDFLFFYSDAHIQDLKRSSGGYTAKELKFMESIVDNNFISYDHEQNRPRLLMVDPSSRFKSVQSVANVDFSTVDINGVSKTVFVNTAAFLKSALRGEIEPTYLSKPHEPLSLDSLPSDEVHEAITLAEMFLCIYSQQENYKKFRNGSQYDLIKKNKCESKNSDTSFNEKLKNSELGVSYMEIVQLMTKRFGIPKENEFMQFTLTYGSLDVMGVRREKSKSVDFWNLHADSEHAYYGSLCDCVVSNDKIFIEKTKIVFSLLNIPTSVVDIDEFIAIFDECISYLLNGDNLIAEIDQMLCNEIGSSEFYDLQYKYWEYFSKIIKIDAHGRSLTALVRDNLDRGCIIPYSEIEIVTNRLLSTFGKDGYGKEYFDKSEIEGLTDITQWCGRKWGFNDYFVELVFRNPPYGMTLFFEKRKE